MEFYCGLIIILEWFSMPILLQWIYVSVYLMELNWRRVSLQKMKINFVLWLLFFLHLQKLYIIIIYMILVCYLYDMSVFIDY